MANPFVKNVSLKKETEIGTDKNLISLLSAELLHNDFQTMPKHR